MSLKSHSQKARRKSKVAFVQSMRHKAGHSSNAKLPNFFWVLFLCRCSKLCCKPSRENGSSAIFLRTSLATSRRLKFAVVFLFCFFLWLIPQKWAGLQRGRKKKFVVRLVFVNNKHTFPNLKNPPKKGHLNGRNPPMRDPREQGFFWSQVEP